MKIDIKRNLFIALIGVTLSCSSSLSQNSTERTNSDGSNETNELSVRYHYTAETVYFDATISDKELTYVHVDEQWIKDECSQWLTQAPCWTTDNLVTEHATLAKSEIADFINLVNEAEFNALDSYYGPDQSRCYDHKLEIVTNEIDKTVVFCSSPNGVDEPEAFRVIRERLEEIIKTYF